MSILNVNKINPVGGGSTVTIAGIASVTSNLSAIDITSTNISVGSSVTTNEFYGDQIKLGDNKKILLGEGNDIEIYHTGAVDMIESKSLYLIQEAQNHIFRNLDGDEAYAKFFGNGAVELYHNGTKQVETSANGLKISAAGKGIDFTAQTTSAIAGVSVTSEICDHYEEGTFTPFLSAQSSAPSVSYGAERGGRYTRIGNMVFYSLGLNIASYSGGSGNAYIGGFPYIGAGTPGWDGVHIFRDCSAIGLNSRTNTMGGWIGETALAGYPVLYIQSMSSTSNFATSFVQANSMTTGRLTIHGQYHIG